MVLTDVNKRPIAYVNTRMTPSDLAIRSGGENYIGAGNTVAQSFFLMFELSRLVVPICHRRYRTLITTEAKQKNSCALW